MRIVINIYNQRDVRTRESQAWKINSIRIMLERGDCTIVARNFTAHGCRWDPRWKEPVDASFWEEIVDEHRQQIGNYDKHTDLWARNS